MNTRSLARTLEVFLLVLLVVAVLWRGGKGIEATWALVAVGCLTAWIGLWIRKREGRGEGEVPLLVWGTVLLFILWTALSWVFSRTQNYGLDEVLREGTAALLLLWVARTQRAAKGAISPFLRRLLLTVVGVTIAACAIGTAVYVFQPVTRFVGSFFYFRFSTDYWPNAWAEYLLLTWPVVLWWVLRARSRASAVVRTVVFGWVIGCLVLSYSRGATVAFLGQVILLFALMLLSSPSQMRAWFTVLFRRILPVVLIALATFFVLNIARGEFHQIESVAKKVTFTADEGASSFTERIQFFSQAWTLSRQRPLLGWGPYSFRFVQPRLQTGILETSDHPHNVFLKLAMERGWPSALLFLALLAFILLPAAGAMIRREVADETRAVILPLFVGACGVLAHNLIDYNLQFVGIVLPLFLFLGAIAGMPSSFLTARGRGAALLVRGMRVLEALLLVVILCVGAWEFRYLVLSSIGRHAEARGDRQDAMQWYALTAQDLYPRDTLLSVAHLSVDQTLYPDAREAVQRYLRRNGEDARAWKLLGEIEMLLFRGDDALRAYRQAFLLSRYDDVGIVSGYLRSAAAGNREEIASQKETILQLLRDFRDAILRNAHFIALSNNVEQYDELARFVATLYPAEATAVLEWDRLVQSHAKDTRAAFSARRPGYLW